MEAKEMYQDLSVGIICNKNYEEPGQCGSAAHFLLGMEMEGEQLLSENDTAHFPLELGLENDTPMGDVSQISVLYAPSTRPDARCVSKARLLSQTLAYLEVATHHIIAISQDCRS
jgi:hypothetical protein